MSSDKGPSTASGEGWWKRTNTRWGVCLSCKAGTCIVHAGGQRPENADRDAPVVRPGTTDDLPLLALVNGDDDG